jgi:hypothetical protein
MGRSTVHDGTLQATRARDSTKRSLRVRPVPASATGTKSVAASPEASLLRPDRVQYEIAGKMQLYRTLSWRGVLESVHTPCDGTQRGPIATLLFARPLPFADRRCALLLASTSPVYTHATDPAAALTRIENRVYWTS